MLGEFVGFVFTMSALSMVAVGILFGAEFMWVYFTPFIFSILIVTYFIAIAWDNHERTGASHW
jgi:hypothetical protein